MSDIRIEYLIDFGRVTGSISSSTFKEDGETWGEFHERVADEFDRWLARMIAERQREEKTTTKEEWWERLVLHAPSGQFVAAFEPARYPSEETATMNFNPRFRAVHCVQYKSVDNDVVIKQVKRPKI